MDETKILEDLQIYLANLDQMGNIPEYQEGINYNMFNIVQLLTNLCLTQYNHILCLENYLKQKDIIKDD